MRARQEIQARLDLLRQQAQSLDPVYKTFLESIHSRTSEDPQNFLVSLPQYDHPVIVTTAGHQTQAAISAIEWVLISDD